jgi:hypothetical protein
MLQSCLEPFHCYYLHVRQQISAGEICTTLVKSTLHYQTEIRALARLSRSNPKNFLEEERPQ